MTSIETGPTWSERLNPRNWTLAWKLAVVGLVPALLALSLGVLRVADQAGTAGELGRSSRLLEVREQVAGAADALRQERDEAVLYVAGKRLGDRGVLEAGFGQADSEVDEMLGAIRSTTTELDPATAVAVAQAEAAVAQLPALRQSVVDPPAAFVTLLGRYSQTTDSLDVLDRAMLRQLRTPGTAGLTDALSAVRGVTSQLATQHTVLGASIRDTAIQPNDANTVNAADVQIFAQFRQYQVALTPEQLARFGNFIVDPANAERQRLQTVILGTPVGRPITLAAAEWDAAYNGSRAAADRSGELIRQELATLGVAAAEQASNLAGINSVILILGLLAGITIALLVARSLIRSLRILRTAALDVAERRLPQAVESMRAGETPDVTVDPVPLTTRDEVGQVARAFDAVHGQAIRLAAEQASLQSNVSAMFVNLSRRSQLLVERQLQLIEQLESNEQDPDQLSNLFALDHLATRMRRNSENLLVLAGTDLAKRNIAPVPMVDVLRAAVSEVEQYQRVIVQAPPTATIVGRAASDLVHLLAELLDNATNFSPPESQVVMSTARTSDGSIVVEIADRGVGMIDHELNDANQRLGGPSSVDVSASRRMGLFVVGRLAARHGVGVRLSSTAGAAGASGLTASVTVPTYLVPSSEPMPAPRPVGVPSTAGVPAQSTAAGAAPGAAPQRAGANGNGRTGSLSALVAGTDGPANPAGMFDTPGVDSPPFTAPSTTNGTPPALPTRRPGSTLRPDGPPASPRRPEPGPRPGAEQAREVAEQARRDQEAAERSARNRAEQERVALNRAAQDRAAQDLVARDPVAQDRAAVPREQPAPGRPGPADDAAGSPAAPDAPAVDVGATAFGSGSAVPPDSRTGEQRTGKQGSDQQGERADEDAQGGESFAPDGGFGNGALPRRPAPVPPSPPTTPMPVVARTDTGADTQASGADAERADPTAQPSPQPAAHALDEPRVAAEPDQAQKVDAAPPPGAPKPAAQPAPGRLQGPPEIAGPPPRQFLHDELFAPTIPVIAEPDASLPSGPAGEADRPDGSEFELGETTPIFEEIASAWFRSNRPVPVTWDTEEPADADSPAPAPEPTPSPTPRPQPGVGRAPSPEPVEVARPPVPPAPAAAEPVRQPVPAAVAAVAAGDRGFGGAADEGWRAASGIESDRPDELTAAGLPKRRPRARLIPGSAGSAVLAPQVTAARSAETIRGRLASYQQGVRQGRESRLRGDAPGDDSGTEPATAGGHHDEESS